MAASFLHSCVGGPTLSQLFTQQIFIEYLLCAKQSATHWGGSDQSRPRSVSMGLTFLCVEVGLPSEHQYTQAAYVRR